MAIINSLLKYSMARKRSSRAQSILEYAVLISVVATALMTMSLYVRRGIQSNLKTLEYQINAEATGSTIHLGDDDGDGGGGGGRGGGGDDDEDDCEDDCGDDDEKVE
ncbi:hypothetical protein ACFL2J_00230 [Candidatus Omnitrophota bacterium]